MAQTFSLYSLAVAVVLSVNPTNDSQQQVMKAYDSPPGNAIDFSSRILDYDVDRKFRITCSQKMIDIDRCPTGKVYLDHYHNFQEGKLTPKDKWCEFSVVYRLPKENMAGIWTCLFPDGSEVTGYVLVKPIITFHGGGVLVITITKETTEPVNLLCNSRGGRSSTVVVHWYKNGEELTAMKDISTLVLLPQLDFRVLNGNYTCSFVDGDLSGISNPVNVVKVQEPDFELRIGVLKVLKCDVEVQCIHIGRHRDRGYPPATIRLVGQQVSEHNVTIIFTTNVKDGQEVSLAPTEYNNTDIYCQVIWENTLYREFPPSGMRIEVPGNCTDGIAAGNFSKIHVEPDPKKPASGYFPATSTLIITVASLTIPIVLIIAICCYIYRRRRRRRNSSSQPCDQLHSVSLLELNSDSTALYGTDPSE